MRKMRSRLLLAAVALCAGPQANAELIFGLTTNNSLVTFDSATPGTAGSALAVTGLSAGETLVGIDFRPFDRQLVGVASAGGAGAVYAINPFTGAATQINTIPTLTGSAFGVDFNPVPNALRIVSDADQNLRIIVGGAGMVNTDGTLNPGNPNVVGVAYSNNVPGGINGQTTLYVIDSGVDRLLTQGGVNFPPGNPPVSPNTGTLFDVGALGFDTGDLVGFDISQGSAIAYASLTAPTGSPSQLFTINLVTGAATLAGTIGGGLLLRDITVSQIPEPETLALLGVVLLAGVAVRRRGNAAS